MFTHRQGFAHPVAALTAILRSEGSRNRAYHPASIRSFARVDDQKRSPGCITDAFGKVMILHQAFDVEVFKRGLVKLSDKVQARFVKEIQSLPFDFQVLPGKQDNSFLSSIAAFLPARNLTLRGLQAALGLTKQLWILNYLTSRKSGEVFNSNVNSGSLPGSRKPAGLIFFNREDNEPSIGFTFDCTGLDRAFNRTAQADPATTNLREVQLVAFQPEAGLGIAEGTEERLAFEAWETRCCTLFDSLKKSIKGLPQPLQRVLKHLAVDICHIFAHLLDCGKLKGLFVIVDRSAIDLPGITAFLKPGVVKFAANIECLRASGLKLRIHSDFELRRLHLKVISDNYLPNCKRGLRFTLRLKPSRFAGVALNSPPIRGFYGQD